MKDIKIMVDAARQLNEKWADYSKGIEKDCENQLIYDSMCEIDEAIINLVEKISLCVKAQSINAMYGDSLLLNSHSAIIERNKTD